MLAIAMLMLVTPGATTAQTSAPSVADISAPDVTQPPKATIVKPQDVDVREMSTREFNVDTPTGLTYLPQSETLVLATNEADGTRLTGVRTWGDEVGRRFLRDVHTTALAARDGRMVGFGRGSMISIAEADLLGAAAVSQRDASVLSLGSVRGATNGPDNAYFVLDGSDIVAVPADGALRLSARTPLAVSHPRGLAYNPGDKRMYVGDGSVVRVFEGTGVPMAEFDLSDVGVERVLGLTFAPSADGTDEPENVSLFVLANVASEAHDLIEVRLPFQNAQTPTDQLRDERGLRRIPGSELDKEGQASQVTHLSASMVKTIDTTVLTDWLGNPAPSSPDPSDIAYDPTQNRLIMVDGEVEEANLAYLYQHVNMFHLDLDGTYLGGGTSSPEESWHSGLPGTTNSKSFSKEPVGAGWYEPNDELMITDDDQDDLSWLKPGGDGIYGTGDDNVREHTDLRSFMGSAADPESAAYDKATGHIWINDAVQQEMWEWDPGADGQFASGTTPVLPCGTAAPGDDCVNHWDFAIHGVTDPEGIAYDEFSDTLMVLSHKTEIIYRFDKLGNLLETIDIFVAGALNAAGLAIGPSSFDPSAVSYWITDRGLDNDNNGTPSPNDGKLYELTTGGFSNFQPQVTLTTPTDGANVAAQPTTVQFRASATDTEDGNVTASIVIESTGEFAPEVCSQPTPTEKVCEVKLNPGLQTVRVKAFDSIGAFGVKIVTLYVGPGPFSVSVPISVGSDDAEELTPGGSIDNNDANLEMVQKSSNIQTVGFRFAGVQVPKNVFVESAYVQFATHTATPSNPPPTNLTIQAQAADNPATFATGSSNNGSISSRPRTSQSVSWSPAAWPTAGDAGLAQRTPNLWPILDPIFARPGWVKGNAVALIVTGTGSRIAKSVEAGVASAPKLAINFQFAPLPPDVTITSPANGASLPIGRQVSLTGTATSRTDGALSSAIQWSSDQDGPLGVGASISKVLSVNQDNSPRTHVITARATDSDGQTATASITVTIQNQAPVVRIDAPANNSAHASTTQIQFVGSAMDPDDGNLSYLLIWRANNNLIGRGSMVRKQLATGVHIISLEVTDRFGVKSTSTITIQVGAGAPPSVSIASPDNAAYPSGSKVTIGGTATDAEQGNLTGTIKWTSNIDGTLGTGGTATAFLTQGTHTITAKVTDNTGQTSTASIQLSMTPGVSVADVSIASALDDAEQFTVGAMRLSSGELNMTSDMGRSQVVGLRYALPVPKGATITEAWVQFTASASDGGAPTLIIECQASDNAPAFTTAWKNISSRPRMPGYVTWNPSPWTAGQHDLAQRTPSLVPLLQKVVSRPGWQAGNATVLIISGSGARTAESFERGLAPILHVDWA